MNINTANNQRDATKITSQSRTASEIAQNNRRHLCEAQRDQRIAARLERLKTQIGKRYAKCSFDDFELSEDVAIRQKQTVILDKLRGYAAKITHAVKAGVGIAMFGTVGCGKDHLMTAMMFEAVRAGLSVQWRDGMSLTREFRSVIDGDASESSILDPLMSCDVLAISDPVPPVGSLSPFAKEKLLSIADRRYRDGKPIWLTLNVSNRAEADERLSPQIVDRITDGGLSLSFNWPSFRLSRRWEGFPNE